jgi:gamma-aminobutyric acid type B receptor
LLKLSYTETDPTFSDQNKYFGFYRLVPSEEQHNDLRIHLIKEMKWKRIGTIYLTKAKYTLAHNMLIRELDKVVNLTVSRSILENQTEKEIKTILEEMILNDIKIIIGIFDINTTIKMFCQIYHNSMYGEHYQWIILGAYNKRQLFDPKLINETSCTLEEILKAINGTLQTRVVQYSYEFNDKNLTINDENRISKLNIIKSKSKFDVHYFEIIENYIQNFQTKCEQNTILHSECLNDYFHGYAFDVISTIFKLMSILIENDSFNCRNDIFERNIEWFQILNTALNKISFNGVTGYVTFRNGSRIGQLKMEQLLVSPSTAPNVFSTYRNVTRFNFDINDVTQRVIYLHDQNFDEFIPINNILWHGKSFPIDHTVKTINKIPMRIFIGMSILTCAGILLAFCFLMFNVRFRKHRFIKMSSPNLNNLIIIGCLISYTSIFSLGDFESLKHICMVRVWLLTVGFTLAFGAMFSKTYRVHAILTNAKLIKKVIKDYKLYGIVIGLLLFDVILLVCWQIFDPLRTVSRLNKFKNEYNAIVLEENLTCESDYMKIWLATLFSFKSILIIFGCFFAYETRNVTISALNDSKYIGMSVYNVLIMCSSGAAIAFIVHAKTAAFILITSFIFACTSITLVLVFLPKILEVRGDPSGAKKQKARTQFKKALVNSSAFKGSSEIDKKINALDLEIKSKKEMFFKVNYKIETLLKDVLNKKKEFIIDCYNLLIDEKDIELTQSFQEIITQFKNEIVIIRKRNLTEYSPPSKFNNESQQRNLVQEIDGDGEGGLLSINNNQRNESNLTSTPLPTPSTTTTTITNNNNDINSRKGRLNNPFIRRSIDQTIVGHTFEDFGYPIIIENFNKKILNEFTNQLDLDDELENEMNLIQNNNNNLNRMEYEKVENDENENRNEGGNGDEEEEEEEEEESSDETGDEYEKEQYIQHR